uniref:Uncharacterized protein n=1 Tax=Noccaea caerulescens TaxID=107243 RepID=A0A1J3IPK4_NOCCA
MKACIILHNMIVEDERKSGTQYDVSNFQDGGGDGSGTSQVQTPSVSPRMHTNVENMMAIRVQVRDQIMHNRLKADLVEHIWEKFGS